MRSNGWSGPWRSGRLRGVRAVATLTALACVAPACSELPIVAADVCGNGVVEGEEDCDTYAEPGTECNPAGSARECRFGCSQSDHQCPSGFWCGIDSVCYAPRWQCVPPASGDGDCQSDNRVATYAPWGQQSLAVPTASLTLADLDGDGRKDLLTLGQFGPLSQALPRVTFFDANGAAASVFDPLIPIGSPVVVDGGGTDRADALRSARAQRILFTTDMGIGTFVATPDRAVVPVAFPNQELPAEMWYRFLPIRGATQAILQEGVLLLEHTSATNAIYLEGASPRFEAPSKSLADTIDPPGAANVIDTPDSPCEEAVLAFRNDPSVYLIEPCDAAGRWHAPAQTLRPVVALPGHTLSRAPLAVDLDNDRHLDLVVTDEAGMPYAAFGRGDGSFAATRVEDPAVPSTASLAWPIKLVAGTCPLAFRQVTTGLPLAIGDLNHDGKPDWVSPQGVFLIQNVRSDVTQSTIVAQACPANAPVVGAWSIARIAEVTGDSFPDLVAGFSTNPGIDFLAGTGRDFMNRLTLSTEGPTTHMVVGDFDGDGVDDVALGEMAAAPTTSTAGVEKLAVAFGSRNWSGNLAGAVEIGRFESIQELGAANYAGEDAIEEIGVLSARSARAGALDLSVFIGSPGRRPIAPLGLSRVVSDMSADYGDPLAAVVGHFESANAVATIVVAHAQCSQSSECPYRAWLARERDAADGDSSGPNQWGLQSPVPSAPFPPELVLVAPSSRELSFHLLKEQVRGPGQWDDALMVVRGSGGIGLWQIDLPAPGVDWQTQTAVHELSAGTLTVLANPAPVLVDMNLDGWPDLAMAVAPGSGNGAATLGVVWNENGVFALHNPTLVDLGGASLHGFQAVKDFGPIHIVAITENGAVAVAGSAERRLQAWTLDGVPPGEAIAVGDVTGDGLRDLVIAESGHVRVFAAVPAKP